MCERKQFEQERVVVKHLFEMRHQPALVDRIARETSAEMVVDATLANAVKREFDRTEIALVVQAQRSRRALWAARSARAAPSARCGFAPRFAGPGGRRARPRARDRRRRVFHSAKSWENRCRPRMARR